MDPPPRRRGLDRAGRPVPGQLAQHAAGVRAEARGNWGTARHEQLLPPHQGFSASTRDHERTRARLNEFEQSGVPFMPITNPTGFRNPVG